MPARAPTVWVVDDDDAMRDALCTLIRSVGLEVEAYPSAEAFLASFRPGQPGCLVLDIRMPGMDGIELQRRLAAQKFEAPIILITGWGELPSVAQTGTADLIQKPFREKTLLDSVKRALERDAQSRRRRKDRPGSLHIPRPEDPGSDGSPQE